MDVDDRDLMEGMQEGFRRASAWFAVSPDLAPRVEWLLKQTLHAWPEEAHGRFVGIFAEMVTIAATARFEYKESPLSEEDVRVFLKVSTRFFNSFTHK